MTNPTLIAQDTPWRGFTFDEIEERLLASRGLTNDSSSGRTVATAAEVTACKAHLRRAFDLLYVEFPNLWTVRNYATTWTSGDHSIALPANTMAVLAVTFDGYNLRHMSRDDYYRSLRSVDEGGDVAAAGRPVYYRISGHADVGSGSKDWRIVMRLHPIPSTSYAGKALNVEYLAHAPAFGTETDPVNLYSFLQGWVLERAKELWSAENGDMAILQTAEKERAKHERGIASWIEGSRQMPGRLTTRYPNVSRKTRYRLT